MKAIGDEPESMYRLLHIHRDLTDRIFFSLEVD